MRRQRGTNDFHLLISLRSFIEYTRKGIWFLAWASEDQLNAAGKLTFERAGSPTLVRMDMMINEALGLGKVSHLQDKVTGVNERFLDCLHALTHGNPLSARVLGVGIEKVFHIDGLLQRAQMENDMFTVLVCRRALGEDLGTAWKDVAAAHNNPAAMRARALDAASRLKQQGYDKAFSGAAGALAQDVFLDSREHDNG